MNTNQKRKTKFRQSAKWKKFKHFKFVQQDGKDAITKSKLRKYSALHHCDLNPEHYEDLSNPDHFVYLNHETHNLIHYIFPYYHKDKEVIDRLVFYLNIMEDLYD